MFVTREMDHAVRIVRALHRGGQLSAAAIAERERIPPAMASKILKMLAGAGLVSSRRGAGGGYLLSRPCRELTLLDVFRALGAEPLVNRCQEPGYRCENDLEGICGTHREFCRIQEVLEAELRRYPLSQVFDARGPADRPSGFPIPIPQD